MKISPYAQQTVEWLQARCGLPTASEFDNLVSSTGEIRKGKMPESYLNLKLAEYWTGHVNANIDGFFLEQGRILEEEAIPWFCLEYNVEVQKVGLITNNEGTIGCSPDGLMDESGLEIKAPASHTHVGYLLKGVVPPEYVHQVQGCMYVTGRDEWKFVSYRRGMPKLVLTVSRDPEYQDALEEALEMFLANLEKAKARMCELNGGPPKRFAAPKPETKFVSAMPS